MNAASKITAQSDSPLAALRVPFAENHISKLPKPTKKQTEEVRADFKKGVRCKICRSWHHPEVEHLDYVGHAALTDRLLDTDIEWSWEPVAFNSEGLPAFDRNGGLWIKLTVCGVTRLGYGSADGKSGGDAVKEIIGDALRNAAMRFGAALDLWHKGDLHAEEDSSSDGGSGQEQNGGRTASSSGPADHSQGDSRITEEQLTKIQMLIKSTSSNEIDFLRAMGAPDGARIFQLPQHMFGDAVELLEKKLARMAKQQSNNASEFAGVSEADCPF